jgi:hypothetical protein
MTPLPIEIREIRRMGPILWFAPGLDGPKIGLHVESSPSRLGVFVAHDPSTSPDAFTHSVDEVCVCSIKLYYIDLDTVRQIFVN